MIEGRSLTTDGTRLAEIRAALRQDGPPDPAALVEELFAVTARIAAERGAALRRRTQTVAQINAALARLRSAASVPELLERGAEALCESCGFDRAVISRVYGSEWKAEVVHAPAPADPEVDRATRAFLAREAIPLDRTLLETQLVRRRVAALITDPEHDDQAYPPMIEATGTRGYVAAPVMPGGRVIGFLHADCLDSRRPLSTEDRDHLWIFAEGFGLIFESLVLAERLTRQREHTLRAVRAVEHEISELCDADVSLDERSAGSVAPPVPAGRNADRADLLLTAREREVLDLMATGASNQLIADRLTLSESTVKSHVVRVRRKLRAANRAEAVSRYLQLRGEVRP